MPLHASYYSPAAEFNPLHIIRTRPHTLAEASREAAETVSVLVRELEAVVQPLQGTKEKPLAAILSLLESRTTTADGRLFLYKLSRGLRSVSSRPWARRALRTKSIAPEPRIISQLLFQLSALMHLAYLATGSNEAQWASIYLYSGYKLVKASKKYSLQQLGQLASHFAAAGLLLLEDRSKEAFALLGWAIRGELRVKPPKEASPTEDMEAWTAALQASHLLDIAPHVEGKLLDAWGYYELLEEALEEPP